MYDLLKLKNAGLRKEVLALTQALVQRPSPSLKEGLVSQIIKGAMEAWGYDKVLQDDCGNIIGILFGRNPGPTLLLNSHMDTVTPGPKTQWTEDPFSGTIKDNKLYGCGASDCKAGLAAQIAAGALLKRSLLPLKGSIVVAATVAEEHGGNLGIRELVQKTLPELELKPDYAILGEPTNLGLYYGHDGWMDVDIRIEGNNSFDVYDAAQNIFRLFNASSSDSQNERDQWQTQNPLYESGNSYGLAHIEVKRRFFGSEKPIAVMETIQKQASMASQASGKVSVKVALQEESLETYTGRTALVKRITHAWEMDPYSTLMERSRQALQAAGCEARTGKWQLGRVGMATAGGFLNKEHQIPVIGYGPGNEDLIHGPNEYVEIDKITEAVYGTAAIGHSLVGVPVFGWTSDDI